MDTGARHGRVLNAPGRPSRCVWRGAVAVEEAREATPWRGRRARRPAGRPPSRWRRSAAPPRGTPPGGAAAREGLFTAAAVKRRCSQPGGAAAREDRRRGGGWAARRGSGRREEGRRVRGRRGGSSTASRTRRPAAPPPPPPPPAGLTRHGTWTCHGRVPDIPSSSSGRGAGGGGGGGGGVHGRLPLRPTQRHRPTHLATPSPSAASLASPSRQSTALHLALALQPSPLLCAPRLEHPIRGVQAPLRRLFTARP